MFLSRRSLIATGVLAGGAVAPAIAAVTAGRRASVTEGLPVAVRQELARRQCSLAMSRYETYLSMARLQKALDQFALGQPDVQADVGFGLYYGPQSVRKLFLEVHRIMEGDAATHTQKSGATYLLANTTEIIEVAEDLKTAQGLWLCPTLSTPGSAETGFSARTGYAHRAADFIFEDGRWKLWHYIVLGLASAPVGKSWTDPDVVAANQVDRFAWIPRELKPDSPPAAGVGAQGGWRPDRPVIDISVPEPYRTFAESFSYGREP